MASFVAIVLVCLKPVSPEACDEKTAVDYMSTTVSSELHCTMGWQEAIAGTTLRQGIGETTYLKTICRPVRARAQATTVD
ncbi:hypothetical protein [Oleomonas cavernae]|uniref:hypothetical protein n=1 Tax=Oleomonas cavernae TaxID=2320859 RepID=UPI0011C349B3|nr:hypothetical protein [Oleomonas cavernae]